MSVKDVVLRLALSALAAIAIPIAVAQASPVTVSQTSTFNTYLQSGDASLTGTFDMNSLISGGGPTYNISSGTLSVHAYSFAQYGAGVAQNYTGYTDPYGTIISCHPGVSCYYNGATGYGLDYTHYYYQSHDVSYTDSTADILNVGAAGTSATATADTIISNSASGYTAYTLTSETYTLLDSNNDYLHNLYYNNYRNVYSAIYGTMDLSVVLEATALDALRDTGKLDFALSVPVGRTYVYSATLSMTYDPVPISTPNATPIPPTLPLFASGLGVMGLLGWRKKRKKLAATSAA